ncbi:MAG: ATP-binding protein [Verrucomicrobiota bacterium]
MVHRTAQSRLADLARWYPAVALTGPRQAGKSTLARATFPTKPYVSLEDPDTRASAIEDPRGFLARFPDGAVLDEVQRTPNLFSSLQGCLDGDPRMGRFVLTGSFQFGLQQGISQSLAGRVGHLHLLPFSWRELVSGQHDAPTLHGALWKGGYPPVHDRGIPPATWFADYSTTYVERDLRQLVQVRDLGTFQRFLRMCATRTAQVLNLSALAADCGVTHNTAKEWLSALEASHVVHLVPPWHSNLGKRLVKAAKLYFVDPGLAAWLAGLRREEDVELGSLRGPLFETWVASECLKYQRHRGRTPDLYHWRDAHGHEVDLLLEVGPGRLLAMECKSGQTVAGDWFPPLAKLAGLMPSLRGAVVYGGDASQTRTSFAVCAWRDIEALLDQAFSEANPSPTP